MAQVAAVRDDPAARLALVTRIYHGPACRAPQHLPFRRAALSVMRWQADRGVLEPMGAKPPEVPLWRAVDERLLRDGCEAVARSGGLRGEPSSPTIAHWMSFIATPTAQLVPIVRDIEAYITAESRLGRMLDVGITTPPRATPA